MFSTECDRVSDGAYIEVGGVEEIAEEEKGTAERGFGGGGVKVV